MEDNVLSCPIMSFIRRHGRTWWDMVGHGGKNDRFWREKRRSSADAGVVPVVAHRVTHPIAHFKRSHCLGVNRVEDVVLLRAQVSKAHLLGILSPEFVKRLLGIFVT
jgi:hypothetical protein